jgi:hypothetical protein
MSVEVEVLEHETPPNLLHFLPEAVDLPQVRVVGLIGVGRAELVVVEELECRRAA